MPRGVPKKNIVPETQEQEALFRWAEWVMSKYPELELMLHIVNEGKRSVAYGAELKRLGLKKGVPDIFLPVPRGKYHGLFIEMKRVGGKTTPEQNRWLTELAGQGYCCFIANKGWNDAAELIKWYMNLKEVNGND